MDDVQVLECLQPRGRHEPDLLFHERLVSQSGVDAMVGPSAAVGGDERCFPRREYKSNASTGVFNDCTQCTGRDVISWFAHVSGDGV